MSPSIDGALKGSAAFLSSSQASAKAPSSNSTSVELPFESSERSPKPSEVVELVLDPPERYERPFSSSGCDCWCWKLSTGRETTLVRRFSRQKSGLGKALAAAEKGVALEKVCGELLKLLDSGEAILDEGSQRVSELKRLERDDAGLGMCASGVADELLTCTSREVKKNRESSEEQEQKRRGQRKPLATRLPASLTQHALSGGAGKHLQNEQEQQNQFIPSSIESSLKRPNES